MQPLPPRGSEPADSASLPAAPPASLRPPALPPNHLVPRPSKNIRELSWPQRRNLSIPPSMHISSMQGRDNQGREQVARFTLPLSLFQAVSTKGNDVNYALPTPTLSVPYVAPPAIAHIIKWLIDVIKNEVVPELPFIEDAAQTNHRIKGLSIEKNVQVIYASKSLGTKKYTEDMYQTFADYFLNEHLVQMDMVLYNSSGSNDGLFCIIASRLAHMRYYDWKWKGFKGFRSWIGSRPNLKAAVWERMQELAVADNVYLDAF
ncbi:hypothetical protein CC80DRAFT_546424 [Byssothecium circinans]|uniref:Uncharacterized protein n=1 Tax=Byssothecium circinans TaxID=147558 RepID=A0A6A5TZZ1_9PLEO|nr:hypothetical protein CC80DRAFT_546424 [Byssothecium circinans]